MRSLTKDGSDRLRHESPAQEPENDQIAKIVQIIDTPSKSKKRQRLPSQIGNLSGGVSIKPTISEGNKAQLARQTDHCAGE